MLSLVGNSLGLNRLTLEWTFDVCAINRFEHIFPSSCKMPTSNGTSQMSSCVSRKSFNINRQVSVIKQSVSVCGICGFLNESRIGKRFHGQ